MKGHGEGLRRQPDNHPQKKGAPTARCPLRGRDGDLECCERGEGTVGGSVEELVAVGNAVEKMGGSASSRLAHREISAASCLKCSARDMARGTTHGRSGPTTQRSRQWPLKSRTARANKLAERRWRHRRRGERRMPTRPEQERPGSGEKEELGAPARAGAPGQAKREGRQAASSFSGCPE